MLEPVRWYMNVENFGENCLNRVLETLGNHYDTIINYFEKRLANASA